MQDIAHPLKIGGLIGGFLLHQEIHALDFCLLPLDRLSHIDNGWIPRSLSSWLGGAHTTTTITSQFCIYDVLNGLSIQWIFGLEHLLLGSVQADCHN